MPPKITSTLSLLDQLRRLGGGDGVVRRAVLEMRSSCRPSRPPLALMSPMTILATLAFASPDERERARLVGDDPHLDGLRAWGW